MHFATRLARESARTVTREDILERRVVALEARLAELETLLRNVTPVTRNADRNVTRNAAGNTSNAERQRRYRERRAALKNKNSTTI